MIIKSDLEACRKEIETCVGHKVRLTTNGGRRRTVVREGILENCYPNVFMVRCIQRKTHGDLASPRKTEMVSFSYIDVVTRTVEIQVGPKVEFNNEINSNSDDIKNIENSESNIATYTDELNGDVSNIVDVDE